MIREDRRIDDGTPAGLSRGFFVWNSQVGYSSFGASVVLFRHVCGNHIFWDVAGVEEIRFRHVEKNLDRAIATLTEKVGGYADASAHEEEQRIAAARKRVLGREQKEVLETVLEWDLPAVTRERAMKAWTLAVRNRDTDGPPTTAWGFGQGVTRLAQSFPFTEVRVALERSAGRILMLAT
jgi:hypothetical protein